MILTLALLYVAMGSLTLGAYAYFINRIPPIQDEDLGELAGPWHRHRWLRIALTSFTIIVWWPRLVWAFVHTVYRFVKEHQ